MQKNIFLTAIICLTCSCVQLIAQPSNKPPDRMKMLNAFNGEWKGEMQWLHGNKKGKYKMSHTSQKIAGGWGVMLSETVMIPDKGKYNAARVFSYSTTGDTTFMYTVDSDGETWFYTGVWKSSKKLELSAQHTANGKAIEKTISYTFLSPKEYDFKSISRAEGKEEEVVELKMKKD
jgi:hypothetical protein